jgi:hypothetical protein
MHLMYLESAHLYDRRRYAHSSELTAREGPDYGESQVDRSVGQYRNNASSQTRACSQREEDCTYKLLCECTAPERFLESHCRHRGR